MAKVTKGEPPIEGVKAVQKYSKARLMESASPHERDLYGAVLEEGKNYSANEAKALAAAYLERRV